MRRSLLMPLFPLCLLAALLKVSPCTAQSAPGVLEIAQATPRSATTAIAAGEQGRSAQVNNWTVGVAGGFFEGTFIRFAVELAKALDDGENLRILPIVSWRSWSTASRSWLF